jgi:hypothetical protein
VGIFWKLWSSIFHRPVDIRKNLAGLQQKMPKLPKVRMPTVIWRSTRPKALLKCHSLGCRFNVRARTDCSLHCGLAKFRGLMRRGKYGAVIGQKPRFFVCAQYELPGYGFILSQSQRCFSPLLLKPRNFAKRQCKLQWFNPPINPKILWRSSIYIVWGMCSMVFWFYGIWLMVYGEWFRVEGLWLMV